MSVVRLDRVSGVVGLQPMGARVSFDAPPLPVCDVDGWGRRVVGGAVVAFGRDHSRDSAGARVRIGILDDSDSCSKIR